MTRPARVLWLTKGLGRGGTERLLTLSVPHVDAARFHVEVAYLLPAKDAFVEEIRAQGVPVHCMAASMPGDVGWVLRLRRLVRTRNFDLVHTHAPCPAVAARVALGRPAPLLLHTEHNVWRRYRTITYASNALTYRRNAAVIAVSHGVAESIVPPWWLPARSMPPVEVLYHGIDEAKVRAGAEARARARAILGLDPSCPVVGSVGNFTPKKNQPALLRAAARLARRHPGLRLVLVGSGPGETGLRAQVRDQGLEATVLFTGSRDDVQEILPAFDVFALSSLHEGLSIALIEAMAAGIPCVCTRVGGVPEAMTDAQEGLLVPPADDDALTAALDRMLRDPRLRASMGARAGATAARFSIRAAVRRTEELYEQLLAAA